MQQFWTELYQFLDVNRKQILIDLLLTSVTIFPLANFRYRLAAPRTRNRDCIAA
jgi:hypothetical protein